jgi:single-strand DNA-binding protein
MNKVILIGRLCADPEFRQTTSGIAVCRIRLAVDRPKQKDQEQQADFVNCTAWRNTAEFISRYFTKGKKIIVEGSLRNNDYTDNNGVKHYSMDVLIQNVEFGESKGSDGGYQQQSAPAQIQQTQAPRAASPAQSPVEQQLDLSDFEEILSDGEVPF